MNYSPQQMLNIIDNERNARQQLYILLEQWEKKLPILEYSKKRELQGFIDIIDQHINASIDLTNMMMSIAYSERDSVSRLKEQNEKLKRFIKNQGFNPNDINWVSLNEI